MRALVVFESMFGNTETVAHAVADGLRAGGLDATTVAVDAAPTEPPDDLALLVVGGPTHAFGMSRASTRADAGQKRGGSTVTSLATGLREFLAGLPPGGPVPVAAFDTRVSRPRVPGSAARAADRRLRRLGYSVAGRPTTFWVTGTPGPLVDDEEERARRWGRDLAASVALGTTAGPGR